MSLHWQNAKIMASQGNLLGEIFEYFEFGNPLALPRREEFLRKIGESLGFEDEWIQKAIDQNNVAT